MIVFGFVLAIYAPAIVVHAQTTPAVVISEVQLGGSTEPKEYVVLQNTSSADVSLDGWLLEYAKPSFDKQFCSAESWKPHAVQGSASAVKLTGSLPAGSTSQPIVRQLTDNTAGSLRLMQGSVMQDLIAWGEQAACTADTPFAIPANDQKLTRTTKPELPEPSLTPAPEVNTVCDSVAVTEISPNPAGIDTGQEFIELHNPAAEAVALQGCILSVTGSAKTFTFTEQVLQPGEYKAFYDIVTGLTLPNAAGGEVVLAGSNEFAVQYPPLMTDGQTWADVNGTWGMGAASPDAPNVLAAVTEEPPAALLPDLPEPCPAGKYRNPETNRCKSFETSDTPAACAAGQERNPETNRCRSVTTAAAQVAPCKEGQERNPATNRCRAVAAATTEPKPCGEDEERNPETNRCRKVTASAKTASQTTGAAASKKPGKVHYFALAAVIVGVTGYGIYEYRQDIQTFLAKRKRS
jgi:hypothetical protein